MNTFRQLSILFAFTLAFSSATATDGEKHARKSAAKPTTAQAVKAPRKEAAAFVDPTTPLAELVERERAKRASDADRTN